MRALTFVFLTFSFRLFGQAPERMSYQAIVRNSDNNAVLNTKIQMRISILQGSPNGAGVYSEIQTPTTDGGGLIAIEIGDGSIIIGTFESIDWSVGPFFIKTEMDPNGGTNYSITGTSQLLSVPYALYAKTSGNGFSGNYSDLTNKPILYDSSWSSLKGKPSLATVAMSGKYDDLSNKP